jgi:hypothetical protein
MFVKWSKTFNQPIGAEDLIILLEPHLIWKLRGDAVDVLLMHFFVNRILLQCKIKMEKGFG